MSGRAPSSAWCANSRTIPTARGLILPSLTRDSEKREFLGDRRRPPEAFERKDRTSPLQRLGDVKEDLPLTGGSIAQEECSLIFRLAGELGFEPRQTESESVVLPLHHSPMISTTYMAIYTIAVKAKCQSRSRFALMALSPDLVNRNRNAPRPSPRLTIWRPLKAAINGAG